MGGRSVYGFGESSCRPQDLPARVPGTCRHMVYLDQKDIFGREGMVNDMSVEVHCFERVRNYADESIGGILARQP